MIRHKSKVSLIILTLLVLSPTGCRSNNSIMDKNKENQEKVKELSKEVTLEDEIRDLISNMTIDEKVGQLIIGGFENTQVSENEIKLIESYKLGGLILFKRNIINYDQTLDLLNELKSINSKNKLPLFLSIDEEGGRVSRLSDIFKNLKPASSLGLNKESLAYKYGQVQALKLKALGLNLNFSPVLDVNSNPNNPVIGDRAISEDPQIVALMGKEVFTGMVDEGIIPVGKHYPGHGDTNLDSHYKLPSINKSLDQLKKLELLPFVHAIRNDIPGLMVGHLYLEAISKDPASLSKEVISDLLRKDQKYEGLVFSDDLTMGAISENYKIEEGVIKFLKAGGDVALICHGSDNIYKAIEGIKNALGQGQILESQVDEKLFRIIRVKKQFNLKDAPNNFEDIKLINDRILKYLDQGE